MDRIDISNILIARRQEAGKTQQEIAAFLGIQQCLYQHYEKNRARPPLEKLIALRDYYGFDSIDLLIDLEVEGKDRFTAIQKAYIESAPKIKKAVDILLSQE